MKHPIDCHVGKRIRLRRWMTGMTQKQLGTNVGIKFQQIQKYETGANRVSASRLYEIAQALDVPVAFFFDKAPKSDKRELEPDFGEENDARPSATIFEEKEAMELVRCYYRWPEQQRRHLLELTRSLTEAA